MSVDIEILGGPMDGKRWVDPNIDAVDFGMVRFGDSTQYVLEMTGVPSPNRDGVILALWSTRRLLPNTHRWNKFFIKGRGDI